MRFWELFIIVVVAVSFAGFFGFTGIMLFTARARNVAKMGKGKRGERTTPTVRKKISILDIDIWLSW